MALHRVEPGEIARLAPLSELKADVRTHALAKTERFEAIRLVVPAAAAIADHSVGGPITLHCLEGKVRLSTNGGVVELSANDWVYLTPGERHSLEGIEDASLLLTIIF